MDADRPWFRFYESTVPRNVELPEMALHEVLDRAAATWPDRIAVRFFVDPGLPPAILRYGELAEASRRFALALAHMGVKKGDRVALMLPNCPQFVIAFYAVLRLGAIAVNTNPLYVSREMAHQFADAGAETVILLDQFYPRMQEAQAQTQVKRVIVTDVAESLTWWARLVVHTVQRKHGERVTVRAQGDIFSFKTLLAAHGPYPPEVAVAPSDVALFQYTGGTTGTPKAAMLTHRNLMANVLQIDAWFTTADEGKEVMLAVLPFFHVYGMTLCLLYALWAGAEIVVMPRPRPIDHVMKVLQRTRASIFPGVPTLYTAINHHPKVRDFDLSSVKICLSGSAPLPQEVQQRFEELTGGDLVEGYGLSETSPVTHANPLQAQRKAGSIGLPLPGTDARIVDLETKRPLAVGEVGEMALHGPQVMKGYWNRPEETAEALRDGWFHTGDVARMDEDGFFYIVDRAKDMIAASGLKVLPRDVEEVLFTHPAVAEAVVAGVPDPYRGETVKAWIVLKPGHSATAEEITAHCKQNLAAFKVPKLIEFRAELPKTMVGKVLRRVLQEEEKAKGKAG
ncbi:MAG TPA: long-chain fatty acid--CoA ligase [Candidatus Polarisedimenticolaceae bacterium]|nr:long-chain fatty acid--CoA ligase [Candidatus Polarisedimenticolaceae bacterium]